MARRSPAAVVTLVILAASGSSALTAGPALAAPPPTSSFEKVKLDGGLSMGEPIELSVLPDGKVFYINRGTSSGGGQVRLYNPPTSSTTVALTRSPIAVGSATPDNGLTPLTVSFSSAGSSDPDGDPLTFAWDFDNNGTTDSTAANPTYTYATNGDKRARLTVNDGTAAQNWTLP